MCGKPENLKTWVNPMDQTSLWKHYGMSLNIFVVQNNRLLPALSNNKWILRWWNLDKSWKSKKNQARESPAVLHIPTSTPAPDRGGHVASLPSLNGGFMSRRSIGDIRRFLWVSTTLGCPCTSMNIHPPWTHECTFMGSMNRGSIRALWRIWENMAKQKMWSASPFAHHI